MESGAEGTQGPEDMGAGDSRAPEKNYMDNILLLSASVIKLCGFSPPTFAPSLLENHCQSR